MTHEPEQEHTTGEQSSDRPFEPVREGSGNFVTPEVLSGPGGPEPEHASRAAALRGLWGRRSARGRAVIAAATVVVLALGGTVAYAATSDGSSGNGASPSASGSHSPSPGNRLGHGLFGLRGVHGEATVKDRDTGEWVVRTWQRGTVEKVDGDQVTVKSEDGTQWTWTVNSDTKVRHDGSSGTGADALKKGEKAFLVGTRSDDGTRTARRVLTGTWKVKDKGKDKKENKGKGWGPGDRGDRFPGHGPRDRRGPSPSADPTGSGAAA